MDAFKTHGAFSWFELDTSDPAKALAFYGQLFGWTHETSDMGGGPYHVLKVGDTSVGGVMQTPPDAGAKPPMWNCYLTVDDVVEGWTTAVVLGSGGQAGLVLVLRILGEYLARILIEVRGRPLYSVRQTDAVVPSRCADHKPDPHFLAGQRDQASALHAEVLQARPGEAVGKGPGS